MAEKNENYKVYENNEEASLYIADHVVEEIIAIAVLDVEGVAIGYDKKEGRKLVSKKITKVLPNKIKVDIDGYDVYISMSVNIIYGYDIIKVCNDIQNRVKSKIQNMTGMLVREVNVKVNSVEVENNAF